MSFKKRASKSTAIILASFISVTPVLNTVYASHEINNTNLNHTENVMGEIESYMGEIDKHQNLLDKYGLNEDDIFRINEERKLFSIDTPMSQLYSDEQVELMKLEFQIENGIDDEFKVVQKSNDLITEINGGKGLIRTTIFNSDGSISNTINENYFKTLDEMNFDAKKIESELSRATQVVPSSQFGKGTIASYFSPYIKVKRDSRDRIEIRSIHTSQVKKYSKPKYNWNSGSTLTFYNAINNSKTHWTNIGKSVGGAALAKIAARLGAMLANGIFGFAPGAIVSFLSTIGIVVTGGAALVINIGKFMGSMNTLHNAWKRV